MSGEILTSAQRFVKMESSTEPLDAILRAAIRDGGSASLTAVQLCYEEMYGDFTYSLEMKTPAASALVAFGVAGLKALVEGAQRTRASKNDSLTLQILSHVASGTASIYPPKHISDEEVLTAIQSHLAEPGLAHAARTLL